MNVQRSSEPSHQPIEAATVPPQDQGATGAAKAESPITQPRNDASAQPDVVAQALADWEAEAGSRPQHEEEKKMTYDEAERVNQRLAGGPCGASKIESSIIHDI